MFRLENRCAMNFALYVNVFLNHALARRGPSLEGRKHEFLAFLPHFAHYVETPYLKGRKHLILCMFLSSARLCPLSGDLSLKFKFTKYSGAPRGVVTAWGLEK